MEEYSSSESEASGYESGHSRFMNEASLSDWDDDGVSYERETSREGQKGAKSKIPRKIKRMENDKKHSKALYDSGLTNSIPITGSSHPQTRDPADKIPNSGINLKGSALRKQLRAVILSDCQLAPLFGTENSSKNSKTVSKPLPDPNKVNELDCLNNRHQSRPYPFNKTFISQLIKSQFKFTNGSSRSSRKKVKEIFPTCEPSTSKRKKKMSTSDSEDEVLKDVKSIARCLLENTLNKLHVKESSRLISDHMDDPVIETPPRNSEVSSDFQIFNTPVPSTSVFCTCDQNETNINAIKRLIIMDASEYANLESENETTPTSLDTIVTSIGQYRNDDSNRGSTDHEGQFIGLEETVEISSHDDRFFKSIAGSSREALFDSNSQIDLLDEFDLPPLLSEIESVRTITTPNVLLIGVNLHNDNDTAADVIFPEWLLQMLRTNFPNENDDIPEGPHFYCQGDGLGVHPSVAAVSVDDEEDDDDVSTDTSIIESRGGVAIDNDNSSLDINSLPTDSQTRTGGGQNSFSQVSMLNISHRQDNYSHINANESEEYFDTSDELSDDVH